MKKMLTAGFLLALLVTLNGCCRVDPPPTEGAASIPISSFSESKENIVTDEPKKKAESEPTEILTQEETEGSQVIAETNTPTVPAVEDVPKSDGAETDKQPDVPQEPAKEQNTEETAPSESVPSEPEPPQPEPTNPPETVEPTQPEFDINYWTDFAKQYAHSIGLALDGTANACWDNPISANPGNTNIEADIISRLNRYKNVEGFTAVWVWAEKVSESGYELYIGYA